MKKLLVLLAFVGCALGASAQGLYVKAHGSFQIGAGESNLLSAPYVSPEEGYFPLIEGDISGANKYAQGSYGEGVYAGVGIGYMFNDYVGIELGIGNLFGSDQDYVLTQNADAFTTTNTFKVLGITPSVVLNAQLSDKLSLTSRAGAFVGVSPELELSFGYSGGGASEIQFGTTIEGTVGIGFQAGLGLDYEFSDALGLTFELSYTGLSFEPENGSVTKYTVDGVDTLNDLSEEFRSFNYGDSQYFNSNGSDLPAYKVSASSLGFGLGLKYRFGN